MEGQSDNLTTRGKSSAWLGVPGVGWCLQWLTWWSTDYGLPASITETGGCGVADEEEQIGTVALWKIGAASAQRDAREVRGSGYVGRGWGGVAGAAVDLLVPATEYGLLASMTGAGCCGVADEHIIRNGGLLNSRHLEPKWLRMYTCGSGPPCPFC